MACEGGRNRQDFQDGWFPKKLSGGWEEILLLQFRRFGENEQKTLIARPPLRWFV
jgi:hypothetical protein